MVKKFRQSQPAESVEEADQEAWTMFASACETAGVPELAARLGVHLAAWPHRRRSGEPTLAAVLAGTNRDPTRVDEGTKVARQRCLIQRREGAKIVLRTSPARRRRRNREYCVVRSPTPRSSSSYSRLTARVAWRSALHRHGVAAVGDRSLIFDVYTCDRALSRWASGGRRAIRDLDE